jgi:hypothetical protein
MSMQNAQPFICEARTRTRSRTVSSSSIASSSRAIAAYGRGAASPSLMRRAGIVVVIVCLLSWSSVMTRRP